MAQIISNPNTPLLSSTISVLQDSHASPEVPPREFFAGLFRKEAPSKGAKIPRRRLTRFGESLTGEVTMERVRAMEEEKRRKEEEKAERAEMRKTKRQEKEEAKSTKRKRGASQGSVPGWFCPYCLKQEKNDNKFWLECDQCQFWYHSICTGYSEHSALQLIALTFICPICEREKEDSLQLLPWKVLPVIAGCCSVKCIYSSYLSV